MSVSTSASMNWIAWRSSAVPPKRGRRAAYRRAISSASGARAPAAPAAADPGPVGLEHDHHDVLVPWPPAGPAGKQEDVCLSSERDPGLPARDAVALAVRLGAGRDGGGVGAGMGLGQAEAAERGAGREAAPPALAPRS